MNENFLIEILKVFGGAAALLGLLAWLSKFLVSHWLTKDIERFKSELQIAATTGVEEIKAHLAQLSTEHQVRFSILHNKRAEIISEIYEKIVDAYSHTLVLTLGAEETGLELHRKRAEAAWESFGTASRLLYTRKIWLSEPLAQKVDKLLSELRDPAFTYHYYTKEKRSEQDVLDAAKAWSSRQHEVSALIEDLEVEFRRELGEAGLAVQLPSPAFETDCVKAHSPSI